MQRQRGRERGLHPARPGKKPNIAARSCLRMLREPQEVRYYLRIYCCLQTSRERVPSIRDTSSNSPPHGHQVLKYGLNHVTTLVENKMAKLVIIAHDVEPIELVCWLPALCRKKDRREWWDGRGLGGWGDG